MKKHSIIIFVLYIFLLISGSIHCFGESIESHSISTILLGGSSTWKMAEFRNGITEINTVRPHPVLVLSSATGTSVGGYSGASGVLGNFSELTESALDLSVSFDERETGLFRDSIGNYVVKVSPDIEAVDRRHARAGTGAALFDGTGNVTIQPQNKNALFSPGSRFKDFTIEFWLYPLNMENGEQVLSWVSILPVNGNHSIQKITCIVSKNRLNWSFNNFFSSSNGESFIDIEFSGNTPVIPKTWSHHLVRFDAVTAMAEYIVNGKSEAIVYATATGRENSTVSRSGESYTPVTGSGGFFSLGERFMGIIDEFKLHKACVERSSVQKYFAAGGRIESKAIDLGQNNSSVIRIDASGGKINIRGNSVNNEYREVNAASESYRKNFRFSDDTEIAFFIRACENPYLLSESRWIRFTPGVNISGLNGRYVQIAADFYPSSDGETSPYLSELCIVYKAQEAPLPPKNVTATAVDGGVLLRWRNSPDIYTKGYLVYYSPVKGELFGNGALQGSSPIDVGNKNSLLIDGLDNGTLYYFRIASYDYISGTMLHNIGEFSVEVTARPLAGMLLSDLQGMEAR